MGNTLDAKSAWESYRPSAEQPWDLKRVGHLYRRASFGARWDELQQGLALGPERAIDALFEGAQDAEFESTAERMSGAVALGNNPQQLKAYGVWRVLATPHPLREKMTLFWHNHFATSNAKVNNAGAMLGQYRLMHEHAFGRFGPLLHAMTSDPAMLNWLDGQLSVKGKPNENYGRELMELFSLGIGHYTEQDIREAARAFTGWVIENGAGVFKPQRHDATDKTVFGQTGPFKGTDIVDLCLAQPACALFLVGKLVRFFVSDTLPLSPELLAPLADAYRSSDYDTGALVRTILRSRLFFSPEAYRSKVKSPVEFAAGMVRGLEGRPSPQALSQALDGLGQSIFYPPSVKGWDGGPAWLNGQTLLFRQNLALALTSTDDPRFQSRCDPAGLARKHGHGDPAAAVEFFVSLFLQGDLPAGGRMQLNEYLAQAVRRPRPVFWTAADSADHTLRATCHLVLTFPEFQLG